MHYGVGCLPVSLLTPLGEKSFGLEIRKGRFHVGLLVWDRLKKAHTTMIHVWRDGHAALPSGENAQTIGRWGQNVETISFSRFVLSFF